MRRRLLKLCYQTISKLRLKKEEENKIELMNICISFTTRMLLHSVLLAWN